MLGAPGTRVADEPTSIEKQVLNRVLLLYRRAGKGFATELEKLLAYFESEVRKR